MFDFSFSELALIGAVALVVLGPERLPKVARTVGEWAGKAQRYVAQVKADINREMEVAELKKLQEQARDMARSIETSVQEGVSGLKADLNATANALNSTLEDGSASTSASATSTVDERGERLLVGRRRRQLAVAPLPASLQARPERR